ncbi:hypothetical protein J8273_0410 [Carpediemonas membranifera]|uniref:Uncharacterized protein n=1 Tax=Carpediemonas membranifera TaxID=201153 RepID=A0A8J6AZH9_9EUKA|nr:hypothetical protein J8273_0410 [Carpediemonas membranifera]|eukprot:KAG9395190.1 hypothetical protein J8273_0410 [Carpediemonas membranifera]
MNEPHSYDILGTSYDTILPYGISDLPEIFPQPDDRSMNAMSLPAPTYDLSCRSMEDIPIYREEMPLYDTTGVNLDELITSFQYFTACTAETLEAVPKKRRHSTHAKPASLPTTADSVSPTNTALTLPFHSRPRSNSQSTRKPCTAFRRNGGPGIQRGMFCACRECCIPMANIVMLEERNQKKTPYCSGGCQTREQNLRQGRVKADLDLIQAKKCMLSGLLALFHIDECRIRPRLPSPVDLSPSSMARDMPSRPPLPSFSPMNVNATMTVGPGDSVCRPMSLQSLVNDEAPWMGMGHTSRSMSPASEYRMLQGGRDIV